MPSDTMDTVDLETPVVTPTASPLYPRDKKQISISYKLSEEAKLSGDEQREDPIIRSAMDLEALHSRDSEDCIMDELSPWQRGILLPLEKFSRSSIEVLLAPIRGNDKTQVPESFSLQSMSSDSDYVHHADIIRRSQAWSEDTLDIQIDHDEDSIDYRKRFWST